MDFPASSGKKGGDAYSVGPRDQFISDVWISSTFQNEVIF
jgi:hypothetical protein